MAAVFGTLPKNPMGSMNRSQEREPSPWEFGTSVSQEVSLPGFDYPRLSISLAYNVHGNMCLVRIVPRSSLLLSTHSD